MMRSGSVAPLALLLGLTSSAIGCGDLNEEGDATEATALSARATQAGNADCGRIHDPRADRDHRFHKRCERYEQKHRRRSNKAGNAVVTTRVLMDAQHGTELEATTGSFDDPSLAPGKIEELRVEIARTSKQSRDGRTVIVKDSKTAGTVRVLLPKLAHGQAMSISARVSGIDRGDDRVTVEDEVQYRPDLAVGAIDVPASPTTGLPTPISATVSELMGDEGAKADCVLSIDGAVVDRASGIWVDSGSMVSCHFVHAFTSGPHRVAVDVVNASPRDYYAGNNHLEVSVIAAAQFTFSGSVYDATYSGEDVEDVLDANGAVLYHRVDTWRGVNQSATVTGSWPTAVAYPLTSVSATATSGGTTWSLVSLAGVEADPTDESGVVCASRNDQTGYNWVGVCSTVGSATPATQISVSTFAGEVTYHSQGVCQTTSAFYDCAGGYTWNSGSDAPPAAQHRLVDSVTYTLGVTGSSGALLQASPAVPVASFAETNAASQTCDQPTDGVQHCYSHKYEESGVMGSVQ
jgi:hypothetical protein